jgi:hypothetical protein
MEEYLRSERLRGMIDGAGLRVAILLGAVCWFFFLWGIGLPALLAGLALSAMGQLALTQGRRRRLKKREAALRARLGGEMLLEEMLLAPRRQAHMLAAQLVGEKYPIVTERVTEAGVLCQSGGEKLLIACIALPPGCDLPLTELVRLQRGCIRHGAVRGVACVTGKVPSAARTYAEQAKTPLRIMERETLLRLAGRLAPATDAQLRALRERKKRLAPSGGVWRNVIRRDKAQRYMTWGTALLLIYVATGLKYYPVPGAACLLLGVISRCLPPQEDRL